MSRAHDARIVNAHIRNPLIELAILLCVGVDQVMKLQSGDRKERLAVVLGVIEAVEQVNAAGTGGRKTDSKPARPPGIGAGQQRGRLMPN